MSLSIFHDCRGMIKTHWLIVQQCSRKCGEIVALEIGAGICDKSKTGGMRFGKSIQRKGSNGKNDLLLRLRRNAVALHPFPQLDFDVPHTLFAALKTKGPAQLFCLSTAESRGNHRHAQQLFLKQRHAQGALQNWLQRGMRINHCLSSLSPHQIRIHHLSHDRPRPNDCHLYHNVVEVSGMQPWQAGHLGSALDLKHADGIGLL